MRTPPMGTADVELMIVNHADGCSVRKTVGKMAVWIKLLTIAIALMPLWIVLGGYAIQGYINAKFDVRLRSAHAPAVTWPAHAAAETTEPRVP